jgi:hypothetical protein
MPNVLNDEPSISALITLSGNKLMDNRIVSINNYRYEKQTFALCIAWSNIGYFRYKLWRYAPCSTAGPSGRTGTSVDVKNKCPLYFI